MSIPEGLDPGAAHVTAEWPHDRPLVACRFDASGEYVFSGAEDALVQRFRLADGTRTDMAGGHDTWVRGLASAGDGRHVVSGGCDGQLAWWEVQAENPQPLRTIAAHEGWIRSLDVSPDGTTFASGGNDHRVRLWDISAGKLIREFVGHERHVYCVAFHPDGQFLLTGDLVGNVKQWDVASGKEVRSFDATPLHSYNGGQKVDFGGVRALQVSPDRRWLAAGGLHKASNPLGAVHEPLILLYDWETQEVTRQLIAEGITRGVIWRIRWLADGTLMALGSGGNGGFLLFWKAEEEKAFHRLRFGGLARDLDLHPDGLQVATAHYDKKMRITRLAAKAS